MRNSMLTRTNIYYDVQPIREVVEAIEPLFENRHLFVTSRPGATDPLNDGSAWLPEGVTEEDFTVLNGPFRGTAIEDLLKLIPGRYGRVRLMRLPPKTCYSFHWDTTTRYQYAVITSPNCYLVSRHGDTGTFFHVPADGYVYRMDTRVVHNAMNCSREPRIHLVISNLDETGPKGGKLTDPEVREIPVEDA